MATVNEGRVDMWVCDKYEINRQIAEALKQMKGLYK